MLPGRSDSKWRRPSIIIIKAEKQVFLIHEQLPCVDSRVLMSHVPL